MAEVKSIPIDFTESDDFLEEWNNRFGIKDCGSNGKFEVVLASYSPDNFKDCVTSNGVLDTSKVTVIDAEDCRIDWVNKGLVLGGDVTISIGDNIVPLKAIFIRHKATGYVLLYSINIVSYNITNQFVLNENTLLLSFISGDYNG